MPDADANEPSTPSTRDRTIARGHDIITAAMSRAKLAEQAQHKNTNLSTAFEAALRQLWLLMADPDAAEAHDQAVAAQAQADAEAASPSPPIEPVEAASVEAEDPADDEAAAAPPIVPPPAFAAPESSEVSGAAAATVLTA